MKKMLCVVLAAVALTACTDEPTVSLEIPKDSPRMSGFVFPNSPSFKALNSRSESTFETEWEISNRECSRSWSSCHTLGCI